MQCHSARAAAPESSSQMKGSECTQLWKRIFTRTFSNASLPPLNATIKPITRCIPGFIYIANIHNYPSPNPNSWGSKRAAVVDWHLKGFGPPCWL